MIVEAEGKSVKGEVVEQAFVYGFLANRYPETPIHGAFHQHAPSMCMGNHSQHISP